MEGIPGFSGILSGVIAGCRAVAGLIVSIFLLGGSTLAMDADGPEPLRVAVFLGMIALSWIVALSSLISLYNLTRRSAVEEKESEG